MKKSKQNLFLISVDKRGLALIYKKTIENPVRISLLQDFISPKQFSYISKKSNNARLPFWCLNETRENKIIWNQIDTSDVILFFKNGEYFSKGRIYTKIAHKKFSEKILKGKSITQPRNLLIFFEEIQSININFKSSVPAFVNPLMPNAYFFPIKKIDDKRRNILVSTFGSIDNAIDFLDNPNKKKKPISEYLPLEVEFGLKSAIIKQRRGNEKFRKIVLSNFGNKCAVCSISDRELLEAGHIVPVIEKKLAGYLKNGICFCILCHRMFDRGYFSFDDNYQLVLAKTKKIDIKLKKIMKENKKIGKCKVLPSKEYLLLHRTKFEIS